AEIAADRLGRRLRILLRIAGEGRTAPQLLNDLAGIRHHLGLRVGRHRQEDLADAILFRALVGVHAGDDRLDLVVADADAAFDLRALQPLPGDLAFDLAAQRFDRRTASFEQGGELLGGLLHVAGDPRDRAVDVR